MSDDDNGSRAADIISYIGIPLAVLGVVPIFYTFINSLWTSHNIRRKLRRNGIYDGLTRSSVLSGIIEVEFPRFSIVPLDRDDPDYWALNPHPSRLKGGSWTIFNWNKLATGKKMYRVQFSADMQVPQAEVDFEELLSFLIDRGARPDPKGFRLLNMAGLWTPANTSLLLSADQSESVLRVTFPDDSDGILSLALQWRKGWDEGASDGLPPHWMRIRDGRPRNSLPIGSASDSDASEKLVARNDVQTFHDAGDHADKEGADSGAVREAAKAEIVASSSIAVHISTKNGSPYIDSVQIEQYPSHSQRPLLATADRAGSALDSVWLAVLATAIGAMNGASIWTIHLPESFTQLAARDSLPCGVLVECGILDESMAPSWATPYDPHEDSRAFHEQHMQKTAAMRAESMMAPAQREAAVQARQAQEQHDMMQQAMNRLRRDRERRDRREQEALESARLSTEVALKAALRTLSKTDENTSGECVEPWISLQTAAETALFIALTDREVGNDVCDVLQRWRVWVERGGMNQEDFDTVIRNDKRKPFCYAIVMMALLKAEGLKKGNSLALDLQECVKTWKRVRLG